MIPPDGVPATTEALTELLEFIKGSRGFDFSGYKRSTLSRRIEKRMTEVGVQSYPEYQDLLEVDADEFTELFNTILINVTGFFRDEQAWQFLAEEIVPRLLEDASEARPIRVWSAGCASGEEAYTIAMVLAEAMGEAGYRRRVKIYATDVDEDALQTARHALYPTSALKPVPRDLVEKYFEPNPGGYVFRGDLRRTVIFGRNDLVQNAPISRIDLLVSRNVLMYFTPDTQARILERFNFALNEDGFLFLGKSEMLITHADLFTPHDMKCRVFRKVPQHRLRENATFLGAGLEVGPVPRSAELRTGANALAPVAAILVDARGFVADANQRARVLFGLGGADIGRPFQDLDLSYRPVDLRSALDQASREQATVRLDRVRWRGPDEEPLVLDVEVTPVLGADGMSIGASITFHDVTVFAHLDEEHSRSKRELEKAYEELQSTVEELETTNEELQSTNEELETTNEELQSTNEELETMNEELQSTNDELEAMNEEQRSGARELDRVNLFLEGILGSLHVGIVVVDRDRIVQLWNASSKELWGLDAKETEGQEFLALDVGLPVADLRDALRLAIDRDESSELTLDAVNRRGRPLTCSVRVQPLVSAQGDNFGAIVLTADKAQVGSFEPDA